MRVSLLCANRRIYFVILSINCLLKLPLCDFFPAVICLFRSAPACFQAWELSMAPRWGAFRIESLFNHTRILQSYLELCCSLFSSVSLSMVIAAHSETLAPEYGCRWSFRSKEKSFNEEIKRELNFTQTGSGTNILNEKLRKWKTKIFTQKTYQWNSISNNRLVGLSENYRLNVKVSLNAKIEIKLKFCEIVRSNDGCTRISSLMRINKMLPDFGRRRCLPRIANFRASASSGCLVWDRSSSNL